MGISLFINVFFISFFSQKENQKETKKIFRKIQKIEVIGFLFLTVHIFLKKSKFLKFDFKNKFCINSVKNFFVDESIKLIWR